MNCEMQGVSYLKLAISKTDYLVPHINDNDKEPSWDGDIEVYRKAGDVHAKADLILKVPVQVKGHKDNNLNKQVIQYPVEYVDMENFLHMGGTIFFVVYVDEEGDHHRIYYAEFLPYNLRRILQKREGKKTKSINMKTFPTNKVDISDVFLGFARDMKKQRTEIYSDEISLEDLIKNGTIPELTFGFAHAANDQMTPFDYFLRGNLFLYAKLPYGVEKVVQHIDRIDSVGTTISAEVTVNGQKFYDEYQVVYKNDVIEVCFGKSTKHIINRTDNRKQIFHFSLHGNLSERILDEGFLIQSFMAQQFEIDGIEYPLNGVKPEDIVNLNLKKQESHLEWLQTVKKILDTLDVTDELDCEKLTEKDANDLWMLKTAIIDNQPVSLENADKIIGVFSIANLRILICITKDEKHENLFRICNFNDSTVEVKIHRGTDEEYLISHYTLLKEDSFLKICNINYEKMLTNIKSIPFSDVYSERIVLLLLEMLKAYDESKDKRKDILVAAIELAKWLKDNDPFSAKEILVLNYLQSIKRKRPFQEDEIRELLQIIELKNTNEEIYTAAYLLLDNQNAAEIHFKRMDVTTQMNFKEYPIFRFFQNNKGAKS